MDMKSFKVRSSAILAITASAAMLGVAFGGRAWAAGIKGRIESVPSRAFKSSTPVNISKGAAAWVYYGYNGQADGVQTDSGNAAGFSAVNCPTLYSARRLAIHYDGRKTQ